MNIKEVENEVGIRKANIRYYEEQGLIHPSRNQENNYRDYSEEDVQCLKKIKLLRLLGIPVSGIKEIQSQRVSLNDMVSKRISEIKDEVAGLMECEKMCRIFVEQSQTYETLDVSLLNMRESLSLQKGATFMKQDRCRNYEGIYQKTGNVFTCYVFLVSLPSSKLMQDLLHYSVPEWITIAASIGLILFGIAYSSTFLLMQREKSKMRKRAEQEIQLWSKDRAGGRFMKSK